MPGRLPTASDFGTAVELTIIPPPPSQLPVNVLILLHGLGDTGDSFTRLGRQLSLPETVCISLQAPLPLPFDLIGFQWGDDIIFDQRTGSIDVDTGFKKSTKLLYEDVILKLVDKCGYQLREILLFGYGQGGMVALAAASLLPRNDELGGIISIAGPLPESTATLGQKNKTPLLVIGGSSKTLITDEAVSRIRGSFQFVEHFKWRRPGDTMPRDRDEMLPIMQFFSRRLRSRVGVPEGSIELS